MMACWRMSIDCVPNDPVDTRAGGPAYLGFDFTFFIDPCGTEKLRAQNFAEKVLDLLKQHSVPVLSSSIVHVTCWRDDGGPRKEWTLEEIEAEIEDSLLKGKLNP